MERKTYKSMKYKLKKQMAKIITQSIWVLSHIYCWVWKLGRNLFRKSDFDYFISNLRTENSPIRFASFFQKKITFSDDREKSAAVRIGDIQIEYSFEKKQKENLVHLFGYDAMEEVIKALIKMTRVSHHNASVFSLAKRRKEQDGTKYRKGNS